jgi:hypothetical protein
MKTSLSGGVMGGSVKEREQLQGKQIVELNSSHSSIFKRKRDL